MKILLTGACGLVGRAVMREAGEAHEFVCMDVSEEVEKLGGVRANVTDREALVRAAEGCDVIIHTAAAHGGFRGKIPNSEFIEVNVTGADNICQAAMVNGIRRVVMSSTLETLCGKGYAAWGRTVYDEYMAPRPDWIYPVTKHMAEILGQAYYRVHKLEVIQLRYAWVRNVPVRKVGLGLISRSIMDSDVATANLAAATRPGLCDQSFFICPDTPLTQVDIELAHRDPWAVLERHWPGCTEPLKAVGATPKPEDFFPLYRLDHAKLMLNWAPKHTFTTYLEEIGWKPGGNRPPEAPHPGAPTSFLQ